jgi:hypothetical protein
MLRLAIFRPQFMVPGNNLVVELGLVLSCAAVKSYTFPQNAWSASQAKVMALCMLGGMTVL